MFRQFRFRLLNEALPDLGSAFDQYISLFRQSPLARALQRLELLTSPQKPDEIHELSPPAGDDVGLATGGEGQFDRPAGASREIPMPSVGEPGTLIPSSAIAFMDAAPRGPADALPHFTAVADGGRYEISYFGDLEQPIVVDTATMEILPNRPNGPQLGGGSSDMLILNGPFDGPTLVPGLNGLETLLLEGGASYDLIASDDHVGRGARLTVDAGRLGPDDTLRFDAGDERDGTFLFLGGAGDDIFLGGAGADRIHGNMGGDSLRGGGGADRFVYFGAGESSGADHDTLLDFNPGEDRIDLPVAVSGFDAAIRAGALSDASFDGDLAAALGSLGAGRAVLFAPNAGDLAGNVFLVVDGNGQAGYQAGEDFVFALGNANVVDVGASAAIFV